MQQITSLQLKDWQKADRDYLLIDIREEWERQLFNIGGLHIPMGDLMARINEIPRDKEVVMYCEKGLRSVISIQRLESQGYTNLYNLSGGMKAWKEGL